MCLLYKINLELRRRYFETKLPSHTQASKWLNTKGDQARLYEVWKKGKLHSRWHWNDKTKRWGRMSTPKKNIAAS